MFVSRSENSFNPKKVLVVIPVNSSFRLPIIHALNNFKIQTYAFDNRRTNLPEKFVFVASKIIKRLHRFGVQSINKRLLASYRMIRPDLVLVIKGENLLEDTVREIARNSIIVNWFPDYLRYFNSISFQISTYSLFFLQDKYEITKLAKLGHKNIYYLPFAAEINIRAIKKKYHITFIGSYSKKRERLFSILKDQNLFIWGDKNWKDSCLKYCYQGKWLKQSEMIKIFQQSKIIINNHRSSLPQNDALNLRCFEVTGSGQFLLSDYRKSFKSLFKIGDEIEYYKDSRELRRKIIYFLENEKLREKIAQNGLKRVKKEHTYEIRLRQMFSIIDQKRSS